MAIFMLIEVIKIFFFSELYILNNEAMTKKRPISGDYIAGGFNTRIVITCFGEEIAPCFDTARHFRYWEIVVGKAIQYRELTAENSDGIARVRLLKQVQANVLICNGISERYRQMLEAEGCIVIDGILGSATDALFGFLANKIKKPLRDKTLVPDQIQPHTADLVDWTIKVFQSFGWEVTHADHTNLFPIDLQALCKCPVCKKFIRVAICCGAHAYRVDDEIREFKRVTASAFDARVYIHHTIPGIESACRDFNIELLDPLDFAKETIDGKRYGPLPPLKNLIAGHDKLNKI